MVIYSVRHSALGLEQPCCIEELPSLVYVWMLLPCACSLCLSAQTGKGAVVTAEKGINTLVAGLPINIHK